MLSLCLVQFVDVLGVTVVVTSLPAILASLHAPASYASLIATGYAAFFGGLLMLGARLGDRFGHRRTIIASLALFAAGAVLSATASSAVALMAGRCLRDHRRITVNRLPGRSLVLMQRSEGCLGSRRPRRARCRPDPLESARPANGISAAWSCST